MDSQSPDPNKIFEVTMTTYLKVEENLNITNGEEPTEQMEAALGGLKRMAGDIERAAGGLSQVAKDLVWRVEEDVERVMAAAKESSSLTDSAKQHQQHGDRAVQHNPEFHTREGNEPVFIYYNVGTSRSQSFVSVVAAVLFIFLLH